MKVQTQQQQQQRGGYSTNEFNNYFKLLTQMETQHQMKLNNLRKKINQIKADKNDVRLIQFIFPITRVDLDDND